MTRRPTPSRSELSKASTRAQKAAQAAEAPPQHPELEHVPTVLELASRGLAFPASSSGNAYRIEPEGYRLMNDAMRRNAERVKADPDLRRRVERFAVTPDRQEGV